jgi:RNA polymerase sigma factor (sigma-70 family)
MTDELRGEPRLDTFCRNEYPRLVGMLDLYCGDLGEAEELAQEALTRVYRHWKKVSTLDRPEAWAQRVAINLANSHFRRKRAERSARSRLGDESVAHTDLAGQLSLRAAIAELPKKMRTALILRYYIDLPYAGVAERMDLPENTARSLVHRAVARLRADSGVMELQEAFDV